MALSVWQGVSPAIADTPTAALWFTFRDRFVSSDGRIVDTGNRGISHSEGQGYGLLFAASFGDRDAFERIRTWTKQNLRSPDSHLHIWRFQPNERNHTPDRNNASDGDLLIALAYVRGARRWKRADLLEDARGIYTDILRLSTREIGSRLLLLPAREGFTRSREVVLNPSYYVMPSLIEASALGDYAPWQRLIADGLRLIAAARFGKWHLPPDWLAYQLQSEDLSPAAPWPPRFSYDAIRIPLYLWWAGMLPPITQSSFETYWLSFRAGDVPAWVNLDDGVTATYPAPSGFDAIADLISPKIGRAQATPSTSSVSDGDYYSASLSLLAIIARAERVPT